MKNIWKLFLIFLLCLTANGQTQSTDLLSLENQLISLDSRLDSLDTVRSGFINQAEIITNKLGLYENRESLTVREHKKLEKLLQESQHINQDIQQIYLTIQAHGDSLNSILRELTIQYQTSIDSLLFEIENKNLPSEKRKYLENRIHQMIEKQKIVQNRLISSDQPAIAQHKIEIQLWDTPEKMRLKGDLLLDQEESIRQEINLVDERIAALTKEKKLRTKMNELDIEVDLFNESEELFNKGNELSGLYDNAAYWNEQIAGGTDIFTERSSTQEYTVLPENPDMDTKDSASRTPETIQQTINRLNQYRSRISSKADSLQQKAEEIHQIADEKMEQ